MDARFIRVFRNPRRGCSFPSVSENAYEPSIHCLTYLVQSNNRVPSFAVVHFSKGRGGRKLLEKRPRVAREEPCLANSFSLAAPAIGSIGAVTVDKSEQDRPSSRPSLCKWCWPHPHTCSRNVAGSSSAVFCLSLLSS